MLPASFRPEGSTFPVHLPPHFDRFYRANLRRVIGSRIRSTSLLESYSAWAAGAGEPSMTFAQMRRCMAVAGHHKFQSNGVHYSDVAYANDVPGVADTLDLSLALSATNHQTPAPTNDLVAKVDAALAALLDLRHAIIGADDAQRPADAARRVLGLFD